MIQKNVATVIGRKQNVCTALLGRQSKYPKITKRGDLLDASEQPGVSGLEMKGIGMGKKSLFNRS